MISMRDREEDADQHQSPGQLLGQDAVGHQRHDRGLGRIELGDRPAVDLADPAADAGVHQVGDLVGRGVQQVLARAGRPGSAGSPAPPPTPARRGCIRSPSVVTERSPAPGRRRLERDARVLLGDDRWCRCC